jgi:acyl-[acyl-carrier-protein]-phospholipid O-acyltransferase/long-chain-fatty-acid--[acyl-carrier-protein] ligase
MSHRSSANPATTIRGAGLIRAVLRVMARLLFRVKVNGNPGQLRHEKMLLVANHESTLDGLLLAAFLPIDATYVVHTTVANRPVVGWLLRFVPHLAIDSTSPLALKQVFRLVDSGRPVVIFPEGRLTVTGSLMKVYDGAAFVAAKSGATVVPVRIEGAGRSYFGRLAGIYPLKLFPRITLTVLAPRSIPMPTLPSAKLRRRRAGELMRRILLDSLVATRPERTLFEAFLDARETFGSRYNVVEDIRLKEESYGSLLRMALGMQRLLSHRTEEGETVGVLMPNAAPTLSLILGLSAGKRVPALLNYTAGAEGMRAACTAANIRLVVASRAFIEKARLTTVVAQLGVTVVCLEDLKPTLNVADKLWILWHLRFPRMAAVPQRPDDAACVLFTPDRRGAPRVWCIPIRRCCRTWRRCARWRISRHWTSS